ncbi:hypothetical protein HJG60_011400 [Phyllostomus discolor]|uniref:Uncharacterized protein n=1 Tax=Phyllostomus discolor TaxID=89673 RepID=A0A834A2U8_9CHIR|nr:hypothetical protein HJG60_011400 [Phyllostomus discolor]
MRPSWLSRTGFSKRLLCRTLWSRSGWSSQSCTRNTLRMTTSTNRRSRTSTKSTPTSARPGPTGTASIELLGSPTWRRCWMTARNCRGSRPCLPRAKKTWCPRASPSSQLKISAPDPSCLLSARGLLGRGRLGGGGGNRMRGAWLSRWRGWGASSVPQVTPPWWGRGGLQAPARLSPWVEAGLAGLPPRPPSPHPPQAPRLCLLCTPFAWATVSASPAFLPSPPFLPTPDLWGLGPQAVSSLGAGPQ